MLKIMGAMLLFTACAAAGALAAARLSRREHTLRLCAELVESVVVELGYNQEPLDEMLEYFCASGRFEGLIFIEKCLNGIKCGMPFPQAFTKAVDGAAQELSMNAADRELVSALGGILGGSDASGQIYALEARGVELKKRASEAHEKAVTIGRLYRTLGIIAGVGTVIMIL